MPELDPDVIRAAVAKVLEGRDLEMTETGNAAPDELGTVTGWRAWRVTRRPEADGQVLLRSASYDYAWVPYEKARASCSRCESTNPRDADCTPGDHCSCGFYCARSLDHLRTMGYHRYESEYDGDVTIVGRVANWGKVIPGSQGWRAEYAYPEMLYVPFEVARFIGKAVAETYGVPVTLMNLLDPNAKPGRKRRAASIFPEANREPRFLAEFRAAQRREDADEFTDDEDDEF